MGAEAHVEQIHRLMGSAHIFSSTVEDMLRATLADATEQNLSLSQVKLLLVLSRSREPLGVNEVADYLGVTNAAASRAIERLVQRGLVSRTVTPGDRRAVDLGLTPPAEALLERFAEGRNSRLVSLLGDYPLDRLRDATRLLDELSVMMLDLEPVAEERCLNCGAHFRKGCVLRDVVGQECAVSAALYGDPAGDANVAEGDDVGGVGTGR